MNLITNTHIVTAFLAMSWTIPLALAGCFWEYIKRKRT